MYWKFIIEQTVGYVTTQTVIEDPIGWSDASFQMNRDRDLHGVFFSYVASLKFYNEAYDLIAAEYALNGVDGEMRLIIQFACSDTDPFEDFYTSKINFSKIEFENSEVCLVSVPIEDDTAFMLFKNRNDQKIDLTSLESLDGEPLDDYSLPFNIDLAPKTFILTTDLKQDTGSQVQDWNDTITVGASITSDLAYSIRYWQIGFGTEIITDVQQLINSFVAHDNLSDVQPILRVDRAGDYQIDIELTIIWEFGASSDGDDLQMFPTTDPAGMDWFEVIITVEIDGVVNDISLLDATGAGGPWAPNTSCTPPDSKTVNQSAFYSSLVTLNQGSEVRLYAKSTFGTFHLKNPTLISRDYHLCGRITMPEATVPDPNYFKAVVSTNNGTTPCDTVLVNEALSRTAESITNDGLRVYSEYFGRTDSQPYSTVADGDGSLEALTTGLAIRRWNIVRLLFSFKDIYDGLNAIHNIGMGLEDDNNYGRPADSQLLRIEPARYFYDDTVILVCDRIPEITRRVLSEEHYSIFQVGYSKWEAEEFNGLDEFATKREYRTTLKTIKNTLTKISNFIASGYAIELTKGKGHGTDDWRYDNDTFIICLLRSYGDFIVEQGNITSPANLIDPDTVYNFRISPERNLLRWLWRVLQSYVDPTTGELLFMDGSANYLAEGLMPDSVEAGVLSESESPVTASTMADIAEGLPVYIPEQWVFDYPMSVDDYHTVKANPRGTIQVRWGQNTSFYNAYIRQIEYKPSKGRATFTLLPKYPFAPITNLDILLQENGDAILQESGGFIVLN